MLTTLVLLPMLVSSLRFLRARELTAPSHSAQCLENGKSYCFLDGHSLWKLLQINWSDTQRQNAIELMHMIGLERPHAAVISAVETVNPAIVSTLDAA